MEKLITRVVLSEGCHVRTAVPGEPYVMVYDPASLNGKTERLGFYGCAANFLRGGVTYIALVVSTSYSDDKNNLGEAAEVSAALLAFLHQTGEDAFEASEGQLMKDGEYTIGVSQRITRKMTK